MSMHINIFKNLLTGCVRRCILPFKERFSSTVGLQLETETIFLISLNIWILELDKGKQIQEWSSQVYCRDWTHDLLNSKLPWHFPDVLVYSARLNVRQHRVKLLLEKRQSEKERRVTRCDSVKLGSVRREAVQKMILEGNLFITKSRNSSRRRCWWASFVVYRRVACFLVSVSDEHKSCLRGEWPGWKERVTTRWYVPTHSSRHRLTLYTRA